MTPWTRREPSFGAYADRPDGAPVYVADYAWLKDTRQATRLVSGMPLSTAWLVARRIPDARSPIAIGRGVFLVRATFGYTVAIDGHTLPLDLSWGAADELARSLAGQRPAGDARGYARCRHDGNAHCFRAGACIHRRS